MGGSVVTGLQCATSAYDPFLCDCGQSRHGV